jgi:hypothetical protein
LFDKEFPKYKDRLEAIFPYRLRLSIWTLFLATSSTICKIVQLTLHMLWNQNPFLV